MNALGNGNARLIKPVLAARDGLGICRVLGYQAQQDFELGTLAPVLTEYSAPALPVQFVFPHSRLLSPRVRQFLDAVVGPLQDRLSGGRTTSLAE